MAGIAETVSDDYERGFKDGLKSECLKELKPIMVELVKGCTDAIKGITPMLIDNAQLTIKHAVNRWISCSERMPENRERVLVCFRSGTVHIAVWYGDYDEKGAWKVTSQFPTKLYRTDTIPKWMPMPDAYEPPESEVQSDDEA